MKQIYDDNDCEAVLLVGASNVINQLNRNVFNHNIQQLLSICLFVNGGYELSSKEGTTQDDPITMVHYICNRNPPYPIHNFK